MKTWLIEETALEAMLEAIAVAKRNGYTPTAEERQEFIDAMHAAHATGPTDAEGKPTRPRNMRVEGHTAIISIEGTLTETPDCASMMFGGGNTTYASIRQALAAADADPEVVDILQDVNSPGGTVEGLFETLAA